MHSFFNYLALRDSDHELAVGAREYLERIWSEVGHYLDPDAPPRPMTDVLAVFWELYLAYALKGAGKKLVPREDLGYINNKGPDLFARNPDVWLEAVAVGPGEGPNKLEELPLNEVHGHRPDHVVLRLRSAISAKSEILKGYIRDGIIKSCQATVIAISIAKLPWDCKFRRLPEPDIVSAVLPVGDPVIEVERTTRRLGDHFYDHRDSVRNKNNAEVATDIFTDSSFAHVSAVLFSECDYVNRPSVAGSDFVVVHNAGATVPLPDRWFPFGAEYWWREGDRLERRSHA